MEDQRDQEAQIRAAVAEDPVQVVLHQEVQELLLYDTLVLHKKEQVAQSHPVMDIIIIRLLHQVHFIPSI